MIRLRPGLVVLVLVVAACDDDKPRGTGATSSGGLGFRSTTGENVKEEPADTFSIPACGAGKLGYITKRWRDPMPAGAVMWAEFTVTASADARIVGFEDHSVPARAALHIQRKSPDSKDPYALDEKYYNRGYREWSHAREALTPGAHVFTEILSPERWNFPDDLGKALADPGYAGITLSGTGSAGHGVCMAAGTASITITRLSIQ